MAMLEELFPQGVFNSKLLGEVKIKKKKNSAEIKGPLPYFPTL